MYQKFTHISVPLAALIRGLIDYPVIEDIVLPPLPIDPDMICDCIFCGAEMTYATTVVCAIGDLCLTCAWAEGLWPPNGS